MSFSNMTLVGVTLTNNSPGTPLRLPYVSAKSSPMVVTPEIVERGNQAMAAFNDYFGEHIARRRASPQQADLLGALLASLSERELPTMAMVMLVAGHENLTNLIGNAAFALLRHPEQLALLRAHLSDAAFL